MSYSSGRMVFGEGRWGSAVAVDEEKGGRIYARQDWIEEDELNILPLQHLIM